MLLVLYAIVILFSFIIMASASYARSISYHSPESTQVVEALREDTLASERPLKSPSYQETVMAVTSLIVSKAQDLDRPLVAGINGIDTSGKTEFTRCVADTLKSIDFPHAVAHVDDFMNPKHIRHQSTDEVDNYYHNMIDFDSLRDKLLSPLRTDKEVDVTFNHPHPADENQRLIHSYSLHGSPSVLLTEGVFLFRPTLKDMFDIRVFLDLPFEEVLGRAESRDYSWGGDAVLEKYRTKYIPTQRMYLALSQPALDAHVVINMSDLDCPLVENNVQ